MSITAPIIGEQFSAAAPKVTNSLITLDARSDLYAGSSKRALVAGIGDSIIGYLLGNQGDGYNLGAASPFFEVVSGHYNADIEINSLQYGFGAAGRRSDYILANMVPAMRDYLAAGNRVPDITIVSAGQNDGVLRLDIADSAFSNITAIASAVRDMGVQNVIVMGVLPDPKITGASRPYALDYLNRRLMRWAAETPGMIPFEVLSLVKDVSGAPEALGASAVWWRKGVDAAGNVIARSGSQEQDGLGGIGSTAVDNEHPAMMFSRLAAPRLEPILRRLVPEYQMPNLTAVPWSNANNPWGNYLGLAGLNMGTGGTVNGTASADVPANWALAYNTTAAAGLTLTPYIRVDANGLRRQGLTFSGRPTGVVVVTRTFSTSAAATIGQYALTGMQERIGVRGMSGYTLNGGGINAGTATSLTDIVPGTVSDVRVVRGLRPVGFSNDFSGKTFTWSHGFAAGVEVEGQVEFWNTAFTREV